MKVKVESRALFFLLGLEFLVELHSAEDDEERAGEGEGQAHEGGDESANGEDGEEDASEEGEADGFGGVFTHEFLGAVGEVFDGFAPVAAAGWRRLVRRWVRFVHKKGVGGCGTIAAECITAGKLLRRPSLSSWRGWSTDVFAENENIRLASGRLLLSCAAPIPNGGHSSMVELQIVVLAVAGSSPVGHPIFPRRGKWGGKERSMSIRRLSSTL